VLRRSSRAKRFSLRVSRSDGRVSMSLPVWAPEHEALAFLRDRADWVRGHLDGRRRPHRTDRRRDPGLWCAQAGRGRSGRAARFADGRILVPEGPRTRAQGSRRS
jgi:predicted metal-dependent hydrolase